MSWEDIVKRTGFQNKLVDEIASDFTALSSWGKFFWEMGGIESTDIRQLWRFIEKPYNWQPEYELANELMEAIGDDGMDLGGLEEYMLDNNLYFFNKEGMKKHIQELKEKGE